MASGLYKNKVVYYVNLQVLGEIIPSICIPYLLLLIAAYYFIIINYISAHFRFKTFK